MTSPTYSAVIEADKRLDTVFSHYYCVRHSSEASVLSQHLLPTYEMLLVFNFGPELVGSSGTANLAIPKMALLGPLHNVLHYELQPGADMIVVNFTLDGFYRLFKVPVHQLKVADWDATHLLDRSGLQELWQQLAPMAELVDRLELINEYIFLNTAPVDQATNLLLDSIPYFAQTAVDPIKAIANNQQVTTRSIQLRFQTHLGYSAKELARFLRFKKVLQWLCQQPSTSVDWLALVLQFGYHDHSHLIKDFQHFLGLSPRQFLCQVQQGNVCISRSGNYY